ncbi:YetF domain-containing protein [Clostridium botulinum]|uniref:YetF domain-containing protein n=1 Tax=Clostridium botulinum TaxID=1491 RepID=UPI0006A543E8|nr:DUF421 domain-containing protein [Clostridium botulinum]KOC36739.1 hypothetical protein ADU81_00135 [Clostridium botulinum]
MFIVMVRTFILYILVVFVMRLMGKRQIGQLEPFELVIAIMISDLASLPMQDLRIPLIHGIIPIITLLVMQSLITLIELKSEKFSSVLTGTPSILIEHGKINIKELGTQRLSFNDLMEKLRLSGYFNISDVEYGILETSGQLSVIPKIKVTPATKQDLNVVTPEEKLPVILIIDGQIHTKNLEVIHKDKNWLYTQLKTNNISSEKEVFIAALDSSGQFFCQCKDNIN